MKTSVMASSRVLWTIALYFSKIVTPSASVLADRDVRKISPGKKSPRRGRVKVRLRIGLGLESGGFFPGGIFSYNRLWLFFLRSLWK